MNMTEWKTQLDAYLDARQDEMFRLLESIVNMDSFSHDAEDVNRLGEYLTGILSGAGFAGAKLSHPSIPEDEPWQSTLGNAFSARTHPAGQGAGLVFLGHMDTVYPAGTAKARPFRMEGDKATGPGVADMKAGLVINMYAAMAIKELGLTDVPMTLLFSPDEELGSPTTTPLFAEQTKGACAVFCTEPGIPGGGVTTARKGSGHMLLEITGISAHAGRNYADGASAVLELAHTILDLDKLVDLPNDITVNAGLVSGGTSANSVAPNARARIHLTFKTLEQGEALVRKIRETVAKPHVQGTVSRISGGMRLYPLIPTAKVKHLYELATGSAAILGMPISEHSTKGAAESGYCATVLDLPALCSLGPEGWNLHSPDEYMTPSTLLPRCKMLALTALQASQVFANNRRP